VILNGIKMDKIDDLIQKGQTFNFRNNSFTEPHGTYSRASDDLLSWVATVEDFIRSIYGEESASFKLYQTFDRLKLNGYEQDDFNEQMTILIGALKSCKSISPKQKVRSEDHQIISLIKNPLFWTVLAVVIGASFALGLQFGSAKFDKEKNEYYQQTVKMTNEINEFHKSNNNKDSTITMLKGKIITLQDSLNKKNPTTSHVK
jgi:hypothetical protein